MAAKTGYHSISAPQPSSRLTVAPPLGHIPPPPPTKPPPYSYFSPQPSNHAHPVAAYGQYAPELYDNRQSIATLPHEVDSTVTESSSIIQTVGQVSESDVTVDLSELKEHKQTPIHDNIIEPEEDIEGEGKYRSDEALKMKFSGGFTAKKRPNPAIAVQLKPQANITKKPKVDAGKVSVAQAFGSDSEDEVEEMPRAAKLRMRNIGKNTPTSAGPNSFNKTTKGFTDTAAAFKKQFDL